MLTDVFRRKIEYLRLSLTDLCNIRCHYCMPLQGVARAERAEILTFEEITRMVRLLVDLGIRRVRLTGGEPLVRKGLPDLVRMLRGIKGLEEILLTTNGLLLRPLAGPLRSAGLDKINIHLDTLDPARFRAIARMGDIQDALAGIIAAKEAGFAPVKLNAVIQKGHNDHEVADLLRFAAGHGLILRLIELMPIGPGRDLMPSAYLPAAEIRRRLTETYTLIPSTVRPGAGPAVYYKVKELDTLVGFISPVSQPFCEGCNRIRISSDGRFQDCLAYDGEFSFRDLLRDRSLSDDDIAWKVMDLLRGKREGHDGFSQLPAVRTPCMNGIGG